MVGGKRRSSQRFAIPAQRRATTAVGSGEIRDPLTALSGCGKNKVRGACRPERAAAKADSRLKASKVTELAHGMLRFGL